MISLADEAYAAEGMVGVLKVAAEGAVDLTPIVGDVKGLTELLIMLAPDQESLATAQDEATRRLRKVQAAPEKTIGQKFGDLFKRNLWTGERWD